MRFKDLIEIIWKNMWKRKARTIFTMMGVIIGCLAIFIISSITNGFERYLTTSMESMMDTSIINLYPNYSVGSNSNNSTVKSKLTDKEIKELKDTGYFTDIIPKKYANTQIIYKKTKVFCRILGVDKYSDIDEDTLLAGKLPKKDSKELLLGYEQAKTVLGYDWNTKNVDKAEFEELIGKKVKLDNESYFTDEKGNKVTQKAFSAVIVGVLPKSNSNYTYEILSSNKLVNEIIKSEISILVDELGEEVGVSDRLNNYETIDVRVKDKSKIAEYEQELKDLGYSTASAKEFEQQTNGILLGVNVILGTLAGISLLVAALGITNTMDMAIYERNKEIGVIKVIGGSVKDVIKIFVGEACAISVFGGVVSIVIGGILTFILNIVAKSITTSMLGQPIDKIAVPSISLILGILAFCLGIGFVSGIIPAKKAAKTDIITAIR